MNASGLDAQRFDEFVRDCELQFGHVRPDDIDDAVSHNRSSVAAYEEGARRRDLDALTLALYDVVSDPTQIVQVSRASLLAMLGWTERGEYRSRHEFPDPNIPYREISDTTVELEQCLAKHKGGYLILLGTPGSGKSTLLTKMLRYRSERVVRYYTYVPDSLAPNRQRGESVNFLHDITLSLDREGFRVGEALARPDVTLLASRLHAQLVKLHTDYLATGRRTLIVVDGLDHVEREQAPERSFLLDLPEPHSVPEGVFFLLGAQTDELSQLPSVVRQQISDPARRVAMRPLTRAAVTAVLTEAVFKAQLATGDFERIGHLSAGHPLALTYIVNRLRNSPDRLPAEVLDEIEPFRDTVDTQYEAHWSAIQDNRNVVNLLALLARVRSGINMQWVESWADQGALFDLRRFHHYFRREPDGRWYFFHNSFRVFLLERTRSLPGVSSIEGDAVLFRQLADHGATAPDGSLERWNEIYYRALCGEHDRVLALAQPHALRDQFYAARPINAIRADVRLGVRSAEALGDGVALAQLALTDLEYSTRDDYLGHLNITALLVAFGETQRAIGRLHDGSELLADPLEALTASVALAEKGHLTEAERVFGLAEPMGLFAQPPPPHKVDEADKLLSAWVEAAPHFRSVGDILDAIDGVRRGEDKMKQRTNEETTKAIHCNLRYGLVRTLQELGRWEDADKVVGMWNPEVKADLPWFFWSLVYGCYEALFAGARDRAVASFDNARKAARKGSFPSDQRVALAELAIRIHKDIDLARTLAEDVDQPSLADYLSTSSGDTGFGRFEDRFRVNRLLGALGDTRPLADVVPSSQDAEDVELVDFERLIVHLGRLWGSAWAGSTLSPSSFVAETRGLLRFFSRKPEVRHHRWYLVASARAEFHRLLVRTARAHGPEVVESLFRAFEEDWDAAEFTDFWPANMIRGVVVEFARTAVPRDWIVRWVKKLEPRTLEGEDHEDRLQHTVDQCYALLDIGDQTGARQTFQTVLKTTLSVGYKDDHLAGLLHWLELANLAEPGQAARRLTKLASYLPWLRDTTEHSANLPRLLLRATCRWKAAAGGTLLQWLLANKLSSFDEGLGTFLTESLTAPSSGCFQIVADAYRHLLLPLAMHAQVDLQKEIARCAIATDDAGITSEAKLRDILDAIETFALPSTRQVLRRAVDDVAFESGISWVPTMRADELGVDADRQEDLSQHFDGPPLKMKEITRLVSTLDGLLELIRRERDTSYFSWEKVVAELIERADSDELSRIEQLFENSPRRDNRWKLHVLISRRFRQLGDRDRAFAVAVSAFDRAPRFGWQERYDGGSQLKTLEAMAAADQVMARKVGGAKFVEDIVGERLAPADIVGSLDRILPLMFDDVSVVALWKVMEEYIDVLFELVDDTNRPSLLPDYKQDSSMAILGFISRYLDHPTYVLSIGAQRVFVDLLAADIDTAMRVLADVFEESGASCLPVLTVIAAAAQVDPETIQRAEELLRIAKDSGHFAVRRAAQILLQSRPTENNLGRRLPSVYAIAFPPMGNSVPLRPVGPGDPLPDSATPTQLVSAFREELEFIAQVAHVQPEALFHRVSQIADALRSGAAVESEQQLQDYLLGIELRRASYRRPRSMLARNAIFHALAELIDAGRIPSTALSRIERMLRAADPSMLRHRPGVRPSCVVQIAERARSKYVGNDWTSAVNIDSSALMNPPDEGRGVIVAEETGVTWLDWKMAKEKRVGVRVPSETLATISRAGEDLLAELCEVWSHVAVDEYATVSTEAGNFIILQDGYRFDTPGRRWLALNPTVARDLGWELDEKGLFRWRDHDGNMMVESLWWQDGLPGMWPPQFDDEVGEGFLVRMSQAGWRTVTEVFGDFTDWIRVTRDAEDQQSSLEEHSGTTRI